MCWRYELRNGKPTKVPFNARTARTASSTAPHTWSSFEQVKTAHLERADFYNGIGYVFSKDDPYCGADFDHCIDEAGAISRWAAERIARLQAAGAYTEISVSGKGIHAITRASVGKGRKKPQGEVYDRGRFFTFSGNRLAGSTPIGDGQGPIDTLYAELGGPADSNPARDGGASTEHSAEEWVVARHLLCTGRDRLLKRYMAATRQEGTQGYFISHERFAEFHERWSFVGLYRADGSLDDSQVRAVRAYSIRPRGFTFAEYVVIMSHYHAGECLTKWGTKDAWRAELERLWNNAPPARHTPTQNRNPDVVISKKPRGRACNHAAQIEKVYQLLLDHRAGAQALIQTADLADEAGMHRVTLAGILAELRDTGRITTARNGRYGGLVVTFPDVVNSIDVAASYPSMDAALPIPDVIIASEAEPFQVSTTGQITLETMPTMEETLVPDNTSCVSSDSAALDYSSSPGALTSDLAQLARAYLDDPDTGRLGLRSKATGEAVRRHTAAHFAELVEAYGYTDQAARAAYKIEQQQRTDRGKAEWQRFFAKLKAMSDAELLAYVEGGCKREVAELARKRTDVAASFDRHLYRTRLKCARQHLTWRGIVSDKQLAQPAVKPSRLVKVKPSETESAPSAERLIAFLYARRAQQALL